MLTAFWIFIIFIALRVIYPSRVKGKVYKSYLEKERD